MAWFWFLVMLLILLAGSSAADSSASDWSRYWQGLGGAEPNLLVSIGPMLFALLVAKAWMVYVGGHWKKGDLSPSSASAMWEHGCRLLTILGALAILISQPLSGITAQVQQARQFSETFAALVALMPLVLLALLMDSLAYQWEQYRLEVVRDQESGPDSEQMRPEFALESPALFLWRRAQMSWILPLIPMLISCLGVDLFKTFFSEKSLQQWAIVVVPGLSLMVAMLVGAILLTVWTKPLSSQVVQGPVWLAMFEKVGTSIRAVRIWDTGNRIANALLIGVWPGVRFVILTDKLLSTLAPRELEMVLLHEAAHTKCRHGWKRFAAVAGCGVTIVAGFQMLAWSASQATILSPTLWQAMYWMGVASQLAIVIGAAYFVRWVWHRTELEADCVACELAVLVRADEFPVATVAGDHGTMLQRQQWKSAMELSSALHNLVGSPQRAARDSWTHPSVVTRVQKLAAAFGLHRP